jgi:hypothetical protein
VTLFNYSGGISRDSGHEVRGNRVAFRQPGGTPFINQTKPPDTLIASNGWSASFSLADLLGRQSP